MKKLQRILAISVLVSLIGLTACDYDFIVPEPIPNLPDTVRFSTEVIPVFNKSCNMSGCHAKGAVAPDLSPANAYADLIAKNQVNLLNPASSTLYVKINTGSMKTYASAADRQKILKWIEQGAKNN